MEAYFDNSATTRCSEQVKERMVRAYLEDYGNPSSLHRKGVEAEAYIRKAREQISRTLKVQEKELVFTSGGTEADNLAVLGAAMANRRQGKHLITTKIEHPAVAAPMDFLEEQGFEVTRLPVDSLGRVSLEQLSEAIRPDTILVSMMYINNEIGTVEPVEEAAKVIRGKNPAALFHVDAIQAYGKLVIHPKKIGIDLMSVSGHKIHGPKGVGFLFVKEKTKLKPILFGGGHQGGLRSGTENVPGIAGLGEAAREAYEDFAEKQAHLCRLRNLFLQGISELEGVRINGGAGALPEAAGTAAGALPEASGTAAGALPEAAGASAVSGAEVWAAPHIVSVSFDKVRSEVLLHALEERKIYVSAGSACSSNKPAVSETLKAIGLKGGQLSSTVRFSFSVYNTEEEVAYCIQTLKELLPVLSRYTRH